ncbi:MAG: hypothetical protein FD180_3296 [Planctomycetota bacterium]|nr:MAG: hypothetical protein FD180_3296 [Planctomycetota bacterium]
MKSFLVLSGFVLACILPGLGCTSTSASGAGGKKLSMLKPVNQTLKRGDTNKVMITVWRESISSDVAVRFDNLPNGVKVIEGDKKVKDSDYVVNYTMFAANDAGLVSGQVVKVTAEGPDGLAVTESFEMTVKE